MSDGFGFSSADIRAISSSIVKQLRSNLKDTQLRSGWTEANLDALRSLKVEGLDVDCYPSGKGKDYKPQFLFDFVGYVQGKGILIAAESEWINKNISELQHDFEKLLYIRSPIKILLCRIDGEKIKAETIQSELSAYMKCCSEYSPGEIFILYCVKWSDSDGFRDDVVYELQIDGEPANIGLKNSSFRQVS